MTETPAVPLAMRRAASCPFDPTEELHRLRAERPIARQPLPAGGFAWLIIGHPEAREVLGDPRFSNSQHRPGALRQHEEPVEMPPIPLIMSDPPEHTRLRRMLTGEFTVRRMNRLRPRIESIINGFLDDIERAGPPADLVPAFALPVPSLVICELLGVPYEDREDFQRRSSTFLDNAQPPERITQVFTEMLEYMSGLVARNRSAPGEDLLGMLVREHGDELSDEDLAGIGNLLLIAGHETTANMLGLGTLLLLRHPAQLAALRDSPETVNQAVEELLRYLSVVNFGAMRTATEDVTIAGQPIKAGERVIVALPAANRDAALCEDPDRFDIGRPTAPHIAFGHGIHHCLGAPLARMEMRIAYSALLRRLPDLRLAVPFEDIPFRMMSTVYGVRELPVTW
jgi:cytochrome P450